jgi:hypothetical protein
MVSQQKHAFDTAELAATQYKPKAGASAGPGRNCPSHPAHLDPCFLTSLGSHDAASSWVGFCS